MSPEERMKRQGMRFQRETNSLDGESVRVLRGGTGGRRVLILHGWNSAAERYRDALSSVPDAAATVVVPDLPGFGATSVPSDSWGIREYAAWVEQLLASLGWEQAVIFGHSFGGRVAIRLAADSPRRCSGLILYSAAGTTPRRRVKVTLFRAIAKAGGAFFALPGLRQLAAPARRLLYRAAREHDYERAGRLRSIFRRVVAEDLTPVLSRITVPTVVLWGTEDRATPFSDAERMHQAIAGSHLLRIDGAGHAVHREDPKRFAASFMRALSLLNTV
jgi:pimeloyl-ACP methyl ester carboxylesterase